MTCPRWLLAAALLTLLPGAASAQLQPEPPTEIHGDGMELFYGLLVRVHGLKPVTQPDLTDPDILGDVVVVSLGSTTGLTNSLVTAERVTRAGGAALIASDTPVDLTLWFPTSAFHNTTPGVTGWELKRATGTRSRYADQPIAPFALPLNSDGGRGPAWDIFRGLRRVAMNRPSCLFLPPDRTGRWVPIAAFPEGCEWGTGRNAVVHDPDALEYPFAAARTDPHQGSRSLVLADPSVFINELMFPIGDAPETDNLKFARRVIDYLQTRDNGEKRTRLALFVNGSLVSDFRQIDQFLLPPEPPLPAPPPIRKTLLAMQDKLVDAGNQIIDRIQQNDVLNSPFRRGEAFRTLMRALLLMAAVWAVWFVLRRVWGTRQPVDVPPAVPGGLPESASGPVGVFDRRQRELLRRNNVYEPARDAVREMFTVAGASPDPGSDLPPVEITDAVRRPDTLRKALADLWRLAYGPPKALTVQQWNVLEPLFLRARRAYADGKWQFAPP
jgi:hypothetical protein